MDAQRWQRIKMVFEQALDLVPDQRPAFLVQTCGDDSELQQLVQAMLEADLNPPSLLQAQPESLASILNSAHSTLPESIGPYRILTLLGHGGMGTVYLAERKDIDKQVALKVVRAGLTTTGRLLKERRILARLEHPHIAQLLDAGVAPMSTLPDGVPYDGVPYFVMEYVAGVSITEYCDQEQLSIEKRLRIFQTVCEAVQYAHQNLIVHRDIKPSNILVKADGMVKLLDFGIAKLLEDDEDPDQALTQTGMRVMTPAYASPEQVQGQTITTASDVYSLGILLYEVLTGHRPYEIKTSDPVSVVRIVCEQEPERPSTVVTQSVEIRHSDGTTETQPPELLSQIRGTNVEKLRRRLQGDLDIMILKALEKEPSRRYSSAEAFLEDIRRHLAGLPVTAQPATLGYRMRKLIQRHRWRVVAAASALVALSVGLGAAAWQAQVARTERDVARAEREKAEQVSSFLVDLLKEAAPGNAQGDALKAYQLLDQGLEWAQELEDQPELKARLLTEMGRVYESMGQNEQAGRLHREAWTLFENVFGPVHPKVAYSISDWAIVHINQGHYKKADSLLQIALTRMRRFEDTEQDGVAAVLNNLGWANLDIGNYEQATSYFREALDIWEQIAPESEAWAKTMSNLASALTRLGNYEEGIEVSRTSLNAQRKHYARPHPDLVQALNNFAFLLYRQGHYDEAESIHREAFAMRQEIYQAPHPSLAIGLNNLGLVLDAKQQYTEAESMHREALVMRRTLFGDDHLEIARSLSNIGLSLIGQKQYKAAEVIHQESLEMRQRLFGENHPEVAFGLHHLGIALHYQGRFREAIPLHERSLSIRQELLGQQHPLLGFVLSDLGHCYAQLHDFTQAERHLLASLEILEKRFSGPHSEKQKAYNRLVELYTAMNQPQKAAPYQEKLSAGS